MCNGLKTSAPVTLSQSYHPRLGVLFELTLGDGLLRLHGDLIYIDVVTLEGNKYCITGSSKSFYVNCSNGSILDPKPTKQSLEASTLVGLLQKISAKFKKGLVLI